MKTVLVPVGLTLADAKHIAQTLGQRDLHFVSSRGSGRSGPRPAPAARYDTRGGKFLHEQRFSARDLG